MTHRAASAQLVVPVGESDHTLGSETAAVTLVEYGDYQCPVCGEAYPIVKALIRRLGRRVRFVFRNFRCPQSTNLQRVRQKPRRPPECRGNSGPCTMSCSKTRTRSAVKTWSNTLPLLDLTNPASSRK